MYYIPTGSFGPEFEGGTIMSIILQLRRRNRHAGIQLVHETSEHVVLGEVFGILRNLQPDSVFNPWLEHTTGNQCQPSQDWHFGFWEWQEKPMGIHEGSTQVDSTVQSEDTLIFSEVKMDAQPSAGTKGDSERNQLIRNLDIGYRRAVIEKRKFFLLYLTPDPATPEIVTRIRQSTPQFPANPGVPAEHIVSRLFWNSWSSIGDALASAYLHTALEKCGRNFVRDLLAYLAAKGLWQNILPDEPLFYEGKLYRSLQRTDSPFVPYQKARRNQDWRNNAWDTPSLESHLHTGIGHRGKLLLKFIAESGGIVAQHSIMAGVPFLRSKSSRSLGATKAHINAGCKALNRAPILSEGRGAGELRLHEINRSLGDLRNVVIETAKTYDV
jgi:hypothetical protein